MLTHPVTSAEQRCHCLVYELAAGLQLPFETRSVSPTTGEPLTTGFTVFDGPVAEPMTSVGADVADALPSAFVAVTTTRSVWPTSPDVGVYVLLVPAVMSPQPLPSDPHRCHWYANDVGVFDQLPSEAVCGDPALGVPLMVGGAVFCGAAAAAADARTPTAASASITARASFDLILMSPTPFSEFVLSLTTRMPPGALREPS